MGKRNNNSNKHTIIIPAFYINVDTGIIMYKGRDFCKVEEVYQHEYAAENICNFLNLNDAKDVEMDTVFEVLKVINDFDLSTDELVNMISIFKNSKKLGKELSDLKTENDKLSLIFETHIKKMKLDIELTKSNIEEYALKIESLLEL